MPCPASQPPRGRRQRARADLPCARPSRACAGPLRPRAKRSPHRPFRNSSPLERATPGSLARAPRPPSTHAPALLVPGRAAGPALSHTTPPPSPAPHVRAARLLAASAQARHARLSQPCGHQALAHLRSKNSPQGRAPLVLPPRKAAAAAAAAGSSHQRHHGAYPCRAAALLLLLLRKLPAAAQGRKKGKRGKKARAGPQAGRQASARVIYHGTWPGRRASQRGAASRRERAGVRREPRARSRGGGAAGAARGEPRAAPWASLRRLVARATPRRGEPAEPAELACGSRARCSRRLAVARGWRWRRGLRAAPRRGTRARCSRRPRRWRRGSRARLRSSRGEVVGCGCGWLFLLGAPPLCGIVSLLLRWLVANSVLRVSRPQASHKSLRTKKTLGKVARQNRPIPQWIRFRTDNAIRYNSKRRNWRRTKLGI
jgi:large subunit ribosomal protein L39e